MSSLKKSIESNPQNEAGIVVYVAGADNAQKYNGCEYDGISQFRWDDRFYCCGDSASDVVSEEG